MKLNAKQLRTCKFNDNQFLKKRTPIYFILENVYDTYNVGGLFRLADALNIEKIYLCGQMEIPPNSKIKKASIGTYKIIPWEYKTTAKEAIEDLRKQTQIQLIAVEQNKRSRHYSQIKYHFPLALLVGNETYGVLPETLALVDEIAEIPMWGINRSLNVIVSAAIIGYHILVNA